MQLFGYSCCTLELVTRNEPGSFKDFKTVSSKFSLDCNDSIIISLVSHQVIHPLKKQIL